LKKMLFLGQGCADLSQNPQVGKAWLEEFCFLPAPAGDIETYAQGWVQHEGKLVGHSLGCLTALEVLAKSRKSKEAVLLCSAPLPTDLFPGYIQKAMMKFFLQSPREFARMMLGKDFMPSSAVWEDMVFAGLTDEEIKISMQYVSPWHGSHIMQAMKSAWGGLLRLSKFDRDSLQDKQIVCVGCELDQMIRPAVSEGIAGKLKARHVLIPNAGHMLMLGKNADSNLQYLHDQKVF
jgi:pimeloyl-ACP methyl ester carboxylesterase